MSTQRIKNYSNAGFITSLRIILIRLIAGKMLVMLNTRIDLVEDNGAAARVSKVNGGVVYGCALPNQHGLML